MKFPYFIIYLFITILAGSYYLGYTPPLIMLLCIVFSVVAYTRYSKDKKAAKKGEWRVPEKSLHVISLLCGWPGAIIAQQRLRHKTKKISFRIVFWLTVLINTAGLTWLHTQQGYGLLHKYMFVLEGLSVEYIRSEKVTDVVLFLTGFRPIYHF